MARLRRLVLLGGIVCAVTGCSREPRADAEAPPPPRKPDIATHDERPDVRADATWPNVLLISIDSLRPDHLQCYGYPRQTSPTLDRIAAEGVLFENAISSTSWTLPAHTAMFTGLSDTVHGVLDTDHQLADDRYTLAERLADVGYQTAGFFSGPYLHPVFGLGQGFERYEDCTSYHTLNENTAEHTGRVDGRPIWDAMHADVTGPTVLEHFTAWHASRDERPFFAFVHLWDVHFDFIPPPPYDTMFDPDYEGEVDGRNFYFDNVRYNKAMAPRDLQHVKALYDGEIAWTDMHVGKMLDLLAAGGELDRTLVIITADHGTAFFEHGLKAHRNSLFDEVIRIPLILRLPGKLPAAARVPAQVRNIDILPTVLALLGMPPPKVMGADLGPLVAGAAGPSEQPAISELFSIGQAMRSVRRREWKIIDFPEAAQSLAFDLRADPGEQHPLADGALFDQARTALERALAHLAAFRERVYRPAARGGTPQKVIDQLRAHGYLGSDEAESEGGD